MALDLGKGAAHARSCARRPWAGDPDEEELPLRDLDFELGFDVIDEVRQQWACHRDRRLDAYDGLVRPSLVLEAAREGGLLIGNGGGHATSSVLRIAPPLSLTVAEAEEGAAILAHALRTADAELGGGSTR